MRFLGAAALRPASSSMQHIAFFCVQFQKWNKNAQIKIITNQIWRGQGKTRQDKLARSTKKLFYNRFGCSIVWKRFGNNSKLIEVWNELTKARCHRLELRSHRRESWCVTIGYPHLHLLLDFPITTQNRDVDPHFIQEWHPDLCFIPWDNIFKLPTMTRKWTITRDIASLEKIDPTTRTRAMTTAMELSNGLN